MKLYLDDLRACPDTWTLAKNFREAVRLVEANAGQITNMDLDHDLGIVYCRSCAFSDMEEPCLNDNGEITCGCTCHVPEPTGLDFLKWVHENGHWPVHPPTVHSANPVGARNMRNFINDFGPYPKP